MKISAQEYADQVVAAEFQQPLKTLAECLDRNGWEHVDRPECCGSPIEIRAMFGSAYFVQCKTCGKFAADVTGPSFGNASVCFIDPEKVDVDTDKLWIAGVQSDGEVP